MLLEHLVVLHQRKSAAANGGSEWSLPSSAFRVETCLRRLWITHASTLEQGPIAEVPDSSDRYRGLAAYEFLLRVACGLESEMAGECEVFGQFRDAWRCFEQSQPAIAREQGPLIQRLFEDVKEIRARHLQSLGAVGYGGLVRHLLGDADKESTLLVGAGQMAQAVIPYLSGRPLFLWNRTRERALALRTETSGVDPSLGGPIVLRNDPLEEIEAWRTVANVILCVPASAGRDALRLDAWSLNPNRRHLLHLGLLDPTGTPWQDAFGLASLRDLFALQSAHNQVRTRQLGRARAACREKARLRSLGGSPSLAHGWEDLSLFASTP